MDSFWAIFLFVFQLISALTFSPLRWVWNFWQREKRAHQEVMELYPELARQDRLPSYANDIAAESEGEHDEEIRAFLERLRGEI